jgi:hypothetical protein
LVNDFQQVGNVEGSLGSITWLNRRADMLRRAIGKLRDEGLPNGGAIALGFLLVLGLAFFVARAAGKPKPASIPRFALPVPLVAQGGPVGRASVLSADSTHRALAVIELKTALIEAIGQRLGLGSAPAPETVREELDRSRLLSKASSAKLAKMLAEMSKAENAVLRSQRLHIRVSDIARYQDQTRAILAELGGGPS